MSFFARHRRLLLLAGVPAIGAVVFVVVWFQPQKIVIENRVNEAAPTPAPIFETLSATGPPDLKGTFTGIEHPTSGTARVISTDGRRVLRFEDFRTSNGPDVVVYLSSADASKRGRELADDFVDLGALKGNIGNQNYAIPSDTELDKYSTVVVWCRRFTVAFGVAALR